MNKLKATVFGLAATGAALGLGSSAYAEKPQQTPTDISAESTASTEPLLGQGSAMTREDSVPTTEDTLAPPVTEPTVGQGSAMTREDSVPTTEDTLVPPVTEPTVGQGSYTSREPENLAKTGQNNLELAGIGAGLGALGAVALAASEKAKRSNQPKT